MRFTAQVEAALRATVFHSPTTYSWFGQVSPRLHPSVRRRLTPQIERNYLLYILQSQLYNDFYCLGSPMPARNEANGLQALGMTPFVRELSAANTGRGFCEDGWDVRAITDGNVVAHRAGLDLWVRRADCMVPRAKRIARGMRLGLRFPKEFLSISPGFYVALSNKALTETDSQRLVRFYWNLTAEGAVRFMRRATLILNRSDLPFRIKAVNDRGRFTRCDAVVLYVRKVDYTVVSEIMEDLYPNIAISLKKGEPAFTKALAVGLGLAEDPGQGESFGFHRCGILAEGMIRANEQRRTSVPARLEVVEECFAHSGINLTTPFLTSSVDDVYHFRPRSSRVTHARTASPPPNSGQEAFLRTAAHIGQRLSQDAVWHEGRCNWMGSAVTESGPNRGSLLMKYSALGPDLYSGTSGVSLFLSELYSTTGHPGVRRTALGAIRQALSRLDAIRPGARLSLDTGWIGIAFAAACVGQSLQEDELLERAAQLLRQAASADHDHCEFDFVSGKAGTIAALVTLRDLVDDASLLAFASRLGDALLQSAEKSDIGYSWKSPGFRGHNNLTGFAHGTAGVAHALLALFGATGDSQYLHGAEEAFRYERYWFDADACNWPDFREVAGQSRRGKHPSRFSTTWCHGAPGIALSRLRAYSLVKDSTYKAEAIAGLEATRQIVKKWLDSGSGNFSLCHGLSGNAEILLYGWQVLGPECADGLALAQAVASAGIADRKKHGHLWPCGIDGCETPGLMLGLAGIGYFYLRLRDLKARSVLSLVRDS
ncbi:MAG: lanthionine synthetase LanC family protein [Nitrospirota bacterium]